MQNSHSLELLLWFHASMEHLFPISCKGLRDNAMHLWNSLNIFTDRLFEDAWESKVLGNHLMILLSSSGLCDFVSQITPNVSRLKKWQEEAQKRRDEERQKEEERCETNKMDDGIWSLKGFFSEGWKGEHIDSTLGSSGRPPCLAAWPNAYLQLRQLEEENQRRVKEGKPSITLEALGLTWFYKHQWPHQTTISIRGSFFHWVWRCDGDARSAFL